MTYRIGEGHVSYTLHRFVQSIHAVSDYLAKKHMLQGVTLGRTYVTDARYS